MKFVEVLFSTFVVSLMISWIPMLMTDVVLGAFGMNGLTWDLCTLGTWGALLVLTVKQEFWLD